MRVLMTLRLANLFSTIRFKPGDLVLSLVDRMTGTRLMVRIGQGLQELNSPMYIDILVRFILGESAEITM